MKLNPKWLTWVLPGVVSVLAGMGCAHQTPGSQPAAQVTPLEKLAARLEEVELTNTRLNVRIEELEEQLFLLQDMAESNRIALQRSGSMHRGVYLTPNGAQAQAPGPVPESYSGSPSPYAAAGEGASQRAPKPASSRQISRIALPTERVEPGENWAAHAESQDAADDAQGAELVITEEQFRAFAGAPEPAERPPRTSDGRQAQAPVTDERLATRASGSSAAPVQRAAGADAANPMALYKSALADYRSGDYTSALAGFQAFLQANPNPTYIDNGLYWIGECHYGLGDYAQANVFFTRVMREQPDGNKVPDAMLKMSLSLERMGDMERSRELLQKLAEQFPSTNAGRLGIQKLASAPEEPYKN